MRMSKKVGNAAFVIISVLGLAAVIVSPSWIPEAGEVVVKDVVESCGEIAAAQEKHFEKYDRYGTFAELAREKLLADAYKRGEVGGYRFEMEVADEGQDWNLTVWPVEPRPDSKSYYTDSTGEIHIEQYTPSSQTKAGPDSPLYWGEGWDK
jgi:hypothetical protein